MFRNAPFSKNRLKKWGEKSAKNIKEHILTDNGFGSLMAVGWGWGGCFNILALQC